MFMAIAAQTYKHPKNQADYKVWYLEINNLGEVLSVGVLTREELVESVFANYRKFGKSNWRAFCKDKERSTPIEMIDFISQNIYENTHFGNLPTLGQFQKTLECLQVSLELRAIA